MENRIFFSLVEVSKDVFCGGLEDVDEMVKGEGFGFGEEMLLALWGWGVLEQGFEAGLAGLWASCADLDDWFALFLATDHGSFVGIGFSALLQTAFAGTLRFFDVLQMIIIDIEDELSVLKFFFINLLLYFIKPS